jgi:hypothetical protein
MIALLLLVIDLRLETPRSATTIEGAWIYAPLDGSPSYRIQIQPTQGGFYEFEGRREGTSKPVLQFDRAEEGSVFRGEVADGFDPCVSAGARFQLYPAAESLVFEPSMPVSAPFTPLLPGACTSARHYFLAAKGRGDQVRLKPSEELAGSRDGDKASANVTIGAPMVPDGAEVELLGSLRDSASRLWHHVRVEKKAGYVPAESVVVRWECRLQR